jgi:hypothetical protein
VFTQYLILHISYELKSGLVELDRVVANQDSVYMYRGMARMAPGVVLQASFSGMEGSRRVLDGVEEGLSLNINVQQTRSCV